MKKPTLSELTLREKIGQTGVICSGALIGHSDIEEHLKNNQYGALWVTGNQDFAKEYMTYEEGNFGYVPTAQEAIDWANGIKKNIRIPVLEPTDCEAGIGGVRRDMSNTHPLRAYGVIGSEELAYKQAGCVARELRACGLNWGFVPCCDVVWEKEMRKNLRYLSPDYELTKKLVIAQIKGMQSQGVAASIKHFPSPDPNEGRNSHISPAVNNLSLEEWEKGQGAIYQAAIDEGVLTIMSGHFGFPAVDDSKLVGDTYIPASLSKKILIGLLKEKMGFKGVIVTDDMNMRASRMHYSRKELYVKLLEAGNDMILGISTYDYVDTVEEAVLNGCLSEERINDACQRVLDLKEKLGLFDDDYNNVIPRTDESIKEYQELNHEVARKCITVTRNVNNLVPIKDKSSIKNIGIVVQEGTKEEEYIYIKRAFEKIGFNVNVKEKIVYMFDLEHIAENNDLIVYILSKDKEHATIRYALTEGREKSIIIMMNSPSYSEEVYSDAETYIDSFTSKNDTTVMKETQEALAELIMGE